MHAVSTTTIIHLCWSIVDDQLALSYMISIVWLIPTNYSPHTQLRVGYVLLALDFEGSVDSWMRSIALQKDATVLVYY